MDKVRMLLLFVLSLVIIPPTSTEENGQFMDTSLLKIYSAPLLDVDECEPNLLVRDVRSFCWYYVCIKTSVTYKMIPFFCPSGTRISPDFIKGYTTPCLSTAFDDLNEDCTLRERTNSTWISECSPESQTRDCVATCFNPNYCIRFPESVPECVEKCTDRKCGIPELMVNITAGCPEAARSDLLRCQQGCWFATESLFTSADFELEDIKQYLACEARCQAYHCDKTLPQSCRRKPALLQPRRFYNGMFAN